MTTIHDVIIKLQQLEKKHGNVELNIYKSSTRTTEKIDEDQIYYDDTRNDIDISIY